MPSLALPRHVVPDYTLRMEPPARSRTLNVTIDAWDLAALKAVLER